MARQYRTMQGKVVDMDQLLQRNEMMPAVGNVKMNARGDELGPGGKVVKTREEVMAAYYENNPNAVASQSRQVPTKTVEEQSQSAPVTKKSTKNTR